MQCKKIILIFTIIWECYYATQIDENVQQNLKNDELNKFCQDKECKKQYQDDIQINELNNYKQQKYRLLQQNKNYQGKIRIKVEYGGTLDIQNKDKQIDEIMKSGIIFFENLLKMNTDENNSINYESKKCEKCDVLIIVNNDDCLQKPLYPTVKFGLSDKQYKTGTISFCKLADQVFKDNYKFKKFVDSIIHGIMKIIAFQKLKITEPCIKNRCSISSDYKNLQSKFQSFYNLNSQTMPAEKLIDNSYLWDMQYAYEDLMTSNFFKDEKVWSDFNNQLLKDQDNWFSSVNDRMTEIITVPRQPINVCNNKNELFCSNMENGVLGCNASLTSKSRCNPINESCSIFQQENDGSCYDVNLNQKMASFIADTGTYEYYGWDSRCFNSDIQKISSTNYTAPIRCYKYACDENYNVNIFLDTSEKGNIPGVDIITCTPEMKDTVVVLKNEKYFSRDGLKCPTNNESFCKKPKPCKNFCSSKGVCVSGKCRCLENYFGDDCSCYKKSQENGKCVDNCSIKMTKDENGICKLICPHKQYFTTLPTDSNSIFCQQCNQNCETCWDSSEKCDSCREGFILHDKQCIDLQNKSCQENQYFNRDIQKCVSCSSKCQKCVIKDTNCTACLSSQFLENNVCTDCSEIMKNCEQCSEKQLCTKCSANNFISILKNECLPQCEDKQFGLNGACVESCPPGYFINSSRLCEICDKNCLLCESSSTFCTKCEYYRELKGNKCKDYCQENETGQNSDNWLFECHQCSYYDKCEQCKINIQSCTKCLQKFYLFGVKCLYDCPTGYFADDALKECVKCDSNCLTCLDKQNNCTSCQSDLFLKTNTCVKTCGDGYYPNNDNKKCELSGKTSDENTPNTQFISILSFQYIKLFILYVLIYLIY